MCPFRYVKTGKTIKYNKVVSHFSLSRNLHACINKVRASNYYYFILPVLYKYKFSGPVLVFINPYYFIKVSVTKKMLNIYSRK